MFTQSEIFKYIVLELRTFVFKNFWLKHFGINVLNIRTKWYTLLTKLIVYF